MAYPVIVYENDGIKRKTHTGKRPKTLYISKEDLLKEQLSLKLEEKDNNIYLTSLEGKKLVKIYSTSATHIIEGLNKLKSRKIIKIETTEERQNFRKVINGLQLKQCPHCTSGFKPKSNSQKYCCKDCSKKARQDKDAERKRIIRKELNKPPIGTINMGQHRKKDYDEEYKFIHKTLLKTLNN